MIYKKIDLSAVTNAETIATLEFYQIPTYPNKSGMSQNKPTILILPGGAYQTCSEREAEPVAAAFLAYGFNCFVLNYKVNAKYPIPHLDVALAMKYIKEHYQEYNLLDSRVTVLGFSAGGHLAASYAYLYKELAKDIEVDPELLKPFALILGYPVISSQKGITHNTTINIISGGEQDLLDKLSVDKHISSDYPSTYIWATKDDQMVPYTNSVLLAEALKEKGVKYSLDLYEKGVHGGSVCSYAVYEKEFLKDNQHILGNSTWIKNATMFIYNLINK